MTTELPSAAEMYRAMLGMPDSMVLTRESWRRHAAESLWDRMLLRPSVLSSGIPGDGPAWHVFAHNQPVHLVRSLLGLWSSELLFAPLEADAIAGLTAAPAFAANATYWTTLLHECATSSDEQALRARAMVPPETLVLPDFLIAWTEMCANLRQHQQQAQSRQRSPQAVRVRRLRTGPRR